VNELRTSVAFQNYIFLPYAGETSSLRVDRKSVDFSVEKNVAFIYSNFYYCDARIMPGTNVRCASRGRGLRKMYLACTSFSRVTVKRTVQ